MRPGTALPGDADLVLLPGSKATIADLAALRAAGLDIDIAAHRRRGGMVLGLCGGYQMLGRSIADPGGIEGPPATVEGLGLLDVRTTLSNDKRLEPVSGTTNDGVSFSGYEMHMGLTEGRDRARPFARLADGSPEGADLGRRPGDRHLCPWACSPTTGSARHGLRVSARARQTSPMKTCVEQTLDALASHLAAHIDLDRLLKLAR